MALVEVSCRVCQSNQVVKFGLNRQKNKAIQASHYARACK